MTEATSRREGLAGLDEIDAVLLDVGGVFLLPRDRELVEALAPFGADPSRFLNAHYAGVAAMDAVGHHDWSVYCRVHVRTAGVDEARVDAAAEALDAILMQPGLWSQVVPGSVPALERLAATGVQIGIVSNADGTVESELLAQRVCQVGEGDCTQVAVVVDSTVHGVEKPDPLIFRKALDVLGADPPRVVHVGDAVHTDVVGARAAGIHPLHLDPFGNCLAPDGHDHVRSLDEVATLVARRLGRRAQPLVTSAAMSTHDRPFGRYFEDFEVGDVYKHWPGKTITEYDDHLFCMITMNHHPLHTNVWFAENETVHKRNVVVGNLVYSLVLGMSVPDVSGAAIANLEVESLTHKKPTFHGDTIYAETRVLDKRESSSKNDRGVVTVETKGFNQDGDEVCYFRRKVMVWKQEFAPPRQRPYPDDVWT